MSTRLTLTRQRAEALLAEVAAEYPDRVVDSCCYVVDDEPSCLVGHVLHRAGWSIADLHDADTANAGNSCAVGYLSQQLGAFAGLTYDAVALLQIAQGEQDDGATWAGASATALSTTTEPAAARVASEQPDPHAPASQSPGGAP